MSDLISRSELIKHFNTIQQQEDAIGLDFVAIIDEIKEQPSAYSVDKVVDELEETMQDLSVIEIFSHIDFDITIQSGLDNFLKAYNSELLRIVKHGGVGTETETIRDKAVKWNNNSSKRVPYEFIDYLEGKREICVSDDVCEWRLCDEESNVYDTSCRNPHILIEGTPRENNYEFCPYCGKKIKVVE